MYSRIAVPSNQIPPDQLIGQPAARRARKRRDGDRSMMALAAWRLLVCHLLLVLVLLVAAMTCCYKLVRALVPASGPLLQPLNDNEKKNEKKSASSSSSSSDDRQTLAAAVPGRGGGGGIGISISISIFISIMETLSFLGANRSGRGFYHFVHERHLRYGPCFRTALFGHTHVFLSSTDAARSLLAAEPPHFSKRYIRTVADLLGQHSLLCSSHATHRFIRRAVAGLFTSASTTAFAATFDRLTTDLISKDWTRERHVVVLDGALRITFRAICEMLIGTLQDDEAKLEQLQSDVLDVTQAMLAFPLRLPGTRFYRGLQARKRIMAALRQEISLRRNEHGLDDRHHHHRNDFLQSLLLKAQSAGPEEALTDEQILDNILTLIIAGQVTTATAITWMVKHLDDNRDFQETLRSVQLEWASKHHDSPLTLEHLNSMEYAYKAVKESLRMATIVSWFPRVALRDCQVAGFHIKKDWIVNVDARSIHCDPAIYVNPMVFDPSRFNDDVKPYSFLVFGAGGRTCLGMNLAKIMMLVFLHRLVTTFRWEMADQDPSLEKWAMFPRLKNGCPIQLTPINKKI